MKWLERYSRRLLLSKAAGVKRQVRICSPDRAKKIGILWHENDQKAFTHLMDHFRNSPAIIRHLCYSEGKVASESNIFLKKDLNWLGLPKNGIIETFIHYEFDLLMNISVTPCLPLEAVTALSVASFKIGWDKLSLNCYDLSVDVSKNPDSLYLAEQQLFYLKTFKRD